MSDVTDGLCMIYSCKAKQAWKHVCGTSDADRGRHPAPSCPQPPEIHTGDGY